MTDVLEATPPAAATLEAAVPTLEAAPTEALFGYTNPTNPGNSLVFELESFDKDIPVNLETIPAETRTRLLKNATKAYITNRVSTADAKTKKDNAAFDQYDAAQKADPLQENVPQPEGQRAVTDYATVIDAAIKALYSGEMGKRAAGEGKKRELRDPLITQITRAVVAEVFQKGVASDSKYKYPTAQKEVGSDGLAYLKAKIAEKVAAGADETAMNKMLDTKYVAPARIMLGLDTPKSLKDMDSIL